MRKIKPETKRRLRNWGLVLGGFGAIGVGCYFGTKKGFDGLVEVAKNAEAKLDHLVGETSAVVDMMQYELDSKRVQRRVINTALDEGIDFKYYPGLGVKFKTVADMEKVDHVLKLK